MADAPPGSVVAVLSEDELMDPNFAFALGENSAFSTVDEQEAALTNNEPLTDLDNDEVSPGSLFASGLIAAGGIMGLMGVGVRLIEGVSEQRGGNWMLPRFSSHNPLYHDPVSVGMFALLAFALYYFARKPLEK